MADILISIISIPVQGRKLFQSFLLTFEPVAPFQLDISKIFNYPDVTYLQREKIKSGILTEGRAGGRAVPRSLWHRVVGRSPHVRWLTPRHRALPGSLAHS